MPDEQTTPLRSASGTKPPPKYKELGEPGWHWLLVLPILMVVKAVNDGANWGVVAAFLFAMVGVAVADCATRLFPRPDDQPGDSDKPSSAHGRTETDDGPKVCNPGMELNPLADERITALPAPAAHSASDAEWYFIHAGKEFGPFSLAELLGKAALGEIEADDLVKKSGGLWIKARDVGVLKQQFTLKGASEGASQGAPAQVSQEAKGTVSPAAWVIFTIGAVLFLLAHGHELSGRMDRFLARFVGYGVFFGGIAFLVRRSPTRITTVASLFLFAAGFDVARNMMENGLPDKTPNAAERFLHRGMSLSEKDYDKAIAEYDEAIRLDPRYAEVFYWRGMAWAKKGEYDKAIKDYDESLRIDPTDPYAWNHWGRGLAWLNKKDYDKAIADYDEVIRLNPNDAGAYHNRGYAWSEKKDYDKAILDYDKAIRLRPNDAGAYHNRGYAWSEKKDYDKAILDYDEAIRLDPNDASAYNSRGLAWSAKNDYDRAIRDYDEAIRLDPKNALAYYSRGYAWAKKKDDDKANKDYRACRNIQGIPEVRLGMKSNEFGKIHGTVHNETGKTIEKLKLSLKTAKWERVYEVKVHVGDNATAPVSVFVGEEQIDIESFNVLSATAG